MARGWSTHATRFASQHPQLRRIDGSEVAGAALAEDFSAEPIAGSSSPENWHLKEVAQRELRNAHGRKTSARSDQLGRGGNVLKVKSYWLDDRIFDC